MNPPRCVRPISHRTTESGSKRIPFRGGEKGIRDPGPSPWPRVGPCPELSRSFGILGLALLFLASSAVVSTARASPPPLLLAVALDSTSPISSIERSDSHQIPLGVGFESSIGVAVAPPNLSPTAEAGTRPSVHTPVRQIVEGVSVESSPSRATYDPSNGFVYVPDGDSATVSVIDGVTPVATIPVGLGLVSAVYDAQDETIYVANSGSASLTLINNTTVEGTVAVGMFPNYAAYDPADGYVYVPNSDSNNVSVVRGLSVVATLDVGIGPLE